MKILYKILQGYEHDRNITINEDELERAYGLFMLGGRWIFSGGPVDGKNIQTIVLDEHATMGWNKEYELGPDDHAELSEKGVSRNARKALELAQKRVRYLIASKQENLIGTNSPLPALENKRPDDIDDGVKVLANKMRV